MTEREYILATNLGKLRAIDRMIDDLDGSWDTGMGVNRADKVGMRRIVAECIRRTTAEIGELDDGEETSDTNTSE